MSCLDVFGARRGSQFCADQISSPASRAEDLVSPRMDIPNPRGWGDVNWQLLLAKGC